MVSHVLRPGGAVLKLKLYGYCNGITVCNAEVATLARAGDTHGDDVESDGDDDMGQVGIA